jgi:hypothetical protein
MLPPMRRPHPLSRVLIAFASVASLAAACAPERVPIDFALPPSEPALGTPFLATPWPSDLLTRDGGLDLATFPNPSGSQTLEDFIQLIETNAGYAASGTLYFRVAGGVDEGSLPADAAASLLDGASLFLVETATLRRIPIVWQHHPDGTSYLPAGTVAVQPLLGALPRGRFALVVTANARAPGGAALGPSPDLLALMNCDALPAGARAVDCAPYRDLADALSMPRESIALLQIVTPSDSTGGLVGATEVVRARPPPAYRLTGRRPVPQGADFVIYDGVVTLAQFQKGAPPFDRFDGTTGGFVEDAFGKPIVQREEEVRFILTAPRGIPPAEGFCIVINGHGTGGDLESGLGDDARAEAWQAARAGCAMLAISEPLHRTREGFRPDQEEVLTFNFFNPVAGRDNWRQSAIEKVELVTLAQSLVVPAAISGSIDVTFDPRSVSYFGHSQGGITGALFAAVEERVTGVFLSGAGAGFQASLVEKVDPVNIKNVLERLLSLPEDEGIDLFHPVIALLQTWVDPADPLNYGPLWRERRGPVPHLVITSGLLDSFTPKRCHGAMAAAFGLPLATPVSEPVEVLELSGLVPAGARLSGNLQSADGAPLTAGVLQYPEDGHFAVFRNPDAQTAMRSFFLTLQRGIPSVQVK